MVDHPSLAQWQADQREYFQANIREIVSEYATWRDAQPDPNAEQLAKLLHALTPFTREIDRLKSEYGFDRPAHQGQTLVLPLSALLALRTAIANCKPHTQGAEHG